MKPPTPVSPKTLNFSFLRNTTHLWALAPLWEVPTHSWISLSLFLSSSPSFNLHFETCWKVFCWTPALLHTSSSWNSLLRQNQDFCFCWWRSWKSPAGGSRGQCFCWCQRWHRCGFVHHLYEALLGVLQWLFRCTVMLLACMSLFSPRDPCNVQWMPLTPKEKSPQGYPYHTPESNETGHR